MLLLVAISAMINVVQSSSIRALDGMGYTVEWWAVLKLPSHIQSSSGVVIPNPCDCPVPDCRNVATSESKSRQTRGKGLCYLYADSRMPEFRYFREIGYECLGQGGNDPLSHTLKQREKSAYWAYFNDQFNGIAAAFHTHNITTTQEMKHVCNGGDVFSAHAKGAVAFQNDSTGGFFLQTSTPNYPDPTRNDSFVNLGCQVDNNVQFAQHVVAMSLDDLELHKLAQELQLARLCSSNFYNDENFRTFLRSDSLDQDGKEEENTTAAAFYQALLNPNLPLPKPMDPMKAEFRLKLSQTSRNVYIPLEKDQKLVDLSSFNDQQEVRVLVKSPRATVPPWALVAEMLDSDISVASWWDGSYGIPIICAGDKYTHSPYEFCLNNPSTGVKLNADGSAPYNIENLMHATWRMNDNDTFLTWQLIGGQLLDGNHAKWGLTTPRSGYRNLTNAYVIFGDLNMEGYPCSKQCNGSQAGRGGTFFSLMEPRMHKSLSENVISDTCRCVSPDGEVRKERIELDADGFSTFEHVRMCHHGCIKKLQEHLEPKELPLLSRNASSFWSK
ncbi:putative deoxyribonuclease II [Plasmopara halstedii]